MQRADRRKYHYIYKITRDDGRYYIGMHSTDDLDDGYFGSGKLITRSVNYHGKERHSKEILEYLPSRELLKEREKAILTEDMRADPLCMNLAPGGGGGFKDAKHQRKCMRAGKEAFKQRCQVDEAFRAAFGKSISDSLRKRTPESLAIYKTIAAKSQPKAVAAANLPEAMAKRKATWAKNGHQQGENNSQFGTCWINKDGVSIKIKKTELEKYVLDGYLPGRIMPK